MCVLVYTCASVFVRTFSKSEDRSRIQRDVFGDKTWFKGLNLVKVGVRRLGKCIAEHP